MAAVNELAPIYADESGEDLYLPDTRPKKDTRSKLIRSQERGRGQIINACPFGCQDHELDETMYCRHLAGDTDPRDDRFYQPIKYRPEQNLAPGKKPRFRYIDGEDLRPVQKGDVLVRATSCARVYRDPPPPIEIGPAPAYYRAPAAAQPTTPAQTTTPSAAGAAAE